LPEKFHLRGRAPNNGPAVCYSGSHRSVDEALNTAQNVISERGDTVWIVDEEGNLVLPHDQVRVRLNPRILSPQNS
jgi:hypothetical protein